MFQPIADNSDGRAVARKYLAYAEGKLSQDTYGRLEKIVDSGSVVEVMAPAAELLYARRDELDNEGRNVCAALASFCAYNGWHSMGGSENRGGRIAVAMMRDNGEQSPAGQPDYPPAETDPAPSQIYARPEEPAAATPIPNSVATPSPVPSPTSEESATEAEG